ncbi:MAG: hypothetical protein KHZ72_01485 [Lachnospiraceae bacterium]|nr:hypothetical protein [Lachnospiraceae bacterium]
MLGKRNKSLEEHAWQEEPCSSFREEIEKKMERMRKKEKLKSCKLCGKNSATVEIWSSGGLMYMVKCNNPDCPVPEEGYPKGRKLDEVVEVWNRRTEE